MLTIEDYNRMLLVLEHEKVELFEIYGQLPSGGLVFRLRSPTLTGDKTFYAWEEDRPGKYLLDWWPEDGARWGSIKHSLTSFTPPTLDALPEISAMQEMLGELSR